MLRIAGTLGFSARSPTRPPTEYCRWVAGWGSGPVPRNALQRISKQTLTPGLARSSPSPPEDRAQHKIGGFEQSSARLAKFNKTGSAYHGAT
jgi:hypothetical protein